MRARQLSVNRHFSGSTVTVAPCRSFSPRRRLLRSSSFLLSESSDVFFAASQSAAPPAPPGSRVPPRATDERRKERREEDEAPRRDAADKKTNLFPELDAAFKVSQFHRCKESSTSCGMKSSIKNHGHGTCMRVTNFTYGSTNDVLASFTVARGSSHGSWGCVTGSGHSGLIS